MLLCYNAESHLLCSLQLYGAVDGAGGSGDFPSSAPKSLSHTIKPSVAFSANIAAFLFFASRHYSVYVLCTWAKVHLQFTGARTAGALNPSVHHLHGQPGGTDVFLHQTPPSEFSMFCH